MKVTGLPITKIWKLSRTSFIDMIVKPSKVNILLNISKQFEKYLFGYLKVYVFQ